MALPYATEDQLKRVKKELEKKIGTGDGSTEKVPTKLSELTNDTGFITTAALTDYALKSELPNTEEFVKEADLPDFATFALKTELPDVSEFVKESELPNFSTYALKTEIPEVDGFATKTEVSSLIKTVGEGLQVGDSEHTTNINTTADNKVMINSVGEIVYSTPYPGEETRKVVQFKNNDQLSGVTTGGVGVPLIFVSKWDKVEVGGSGAPLNLNGSTDRVTYKDDEELAFVSDLERMPLVCTMPFRKVSGYLGDDGTKFSKETVLGWFGVSTIAELKELVIKKPIYLMYGITLTGKPMYYYIPCQYVAFTANNKLELITDGLDTNNDKLSRYKIVLTFVLDSEATVEDTEIAITVDDYLHLPKLPEDANTKTYQLKAVNGTLTWVE